MNMLKNIKNAKTESILESFKEIDILIKELTAYKDNLKTEIINRQDNNPLDYETRDGRHTITLRFVKGSKSIDTKKAKELLPNWQETCFTMRSDSIVLKVNDLKK